MIAIIDYGMGNLRSVEKALEYIGQRATITSDSAEIAGAERVILPGVGAFRDAIGELKRSGLDAAFSHAVSAGKPALGICLGMQLLFAQSDEFGLYDGLGLLEGTITRMEGDQGLKIPHMGWNTVIAKGNSPLLRGIDGEDFYFVHSHAALDVTAGYASGICSYGGDFVAMVSQGNLHGAQFHPEKSGEAGLALLRNFASL